MILSCMLVLDSFFIYDVSDGGSLWAEVWITTTEYIEPWFPE